MTLDTSNAEKYGHRCVELEAQLEATTAQLEADLRVKALVGALEPCLEMLDALVIESARFIEYGEEDAFRMGEWFEREEIEAIEAARAALAQLKEPKVKELLNVPTMQ